MLEGGRTSVAPRPATLSPALRALASLLLLGAWFGALAGCGQKGPLTLPAAAAAPAAAASAP